MLKPKENFLKFFSWGISATVTDKLLLKQVFHCCTRSNLTLCNLNGNLYRATSRKPVDRDQLRKLVSKHQFFIFSSKKKNNCASHSIRIFCIYFIDKIYNWLSSLHLFYTFSRLNFSLFVFLCLHLFHTFKMIFSLSPSLSLFLSVSPSVSEPHLQLSFHIRLWYYFLQFLRKRLTK